MWNYLHIFLNWSEAWAPLMPIFVLLKNRNQPAFLRPVIIYILIAFPINLFGDIIGDFKKYFPDWLQENIYLYNIHSVIRFVCFSSFFLGLKQEYYTLLKKIISVVYLIFLFVDLIISENFLGKEGIAANLFAGEAFLLLVYCLLYYLSKLKNDNDSLIAGADIYVVTGLSIFVVTNFFVFLFYDSMLDENWQLADNMWSVHNIAYIILCLLIAKAFSSGKKITLWRKACQEVRGIE